MGNLTALKKQGPFSGIKITPEILWMASTLIVPLVLLLFLPLETVFILTTLALFILTISFFRIRKERDRCNHSWAVCRNLLAQKTKSPHTEET